MNSVHTLIQQILQHIPKDEELYSRLKDILEVDDWKNHRLELKVLIAPTGEIQDISIRDGWGEEFLHIANQLDSLI